MFPPVIILNIDNFIHKKKFTSPFELPVKKNTLLIFTKSAHALETEISKLIQNVLKI